MQINHTTPVQVWNADEERARARVVNSRAHAGVQPGRVIYGLGCVNLWADDLHTANADRGWVALLNFD